MASSSRLQLFLSNVRRAYVHTNATSPTVSAAATEPPIFSCTVGESKLSREQRVFYEENGYIVIRKLVAPEKLEAYRKRFLQICKLEVKVPNITFMRDIAIKDTEIGSGQQVINKIQDWQEDPVLFSFCTLPEIVDYVEDFVGPDIVAIQTMMINKPPDTGKLTSRHPFHQDLYYSPYRPANLFMGVWTAMQTITRENGCLVVLPGSHKKGILPHVYPKWEGGVNKMYHGITEYDPNCKKDYLEMEAGDTVFFHSQLVHGSGTNRSKNYRKSISCHYVSAKCDVLQDLDSVQDTIKDELVSLRKKHFKESGERIYQDFYLKKSRHVRGELGDFGKRLKSDKATENTV